MIDFLRSNPWCSREEFTWGMSVAQIRLASLDYSHVEYLKSEEELKKQQSTIRIGGGEDMKLLNDLGVPMI